MVKRYSKTLLVVVVVMVLVLVTFAGCSGSSNNSASSSGSGDGYVITCTVGGAGTPIMVEYGTFATLVGKVYGNDTTVVDDQFRADMQMLNIQNAISKGVDGIITTPVYPEQVPAIAEMCEAAKIPFVFYDTDMTEPAYEKIKNNPYFVGMVTTDGDECGRQIAREALAAGCTKAVLIGGQVGQDYFDRRAAGFTEVFEAGGGKVLGIARCTDPSEAPTKGEDLLSANRDTDCVYGMASDFIDGGTYTALENLGLVENANVYCSNVFTRTAQYILDGKYESGNNGSNLPSQIAHALLQNYLDGHPIKDPDGLPPYLKITTFMVTPANAEVYMKWFHDDDIIPLSEATIKKLTYRFNDKVTYEDYYDLVKNQMSVEKIAAMHN